MVIKRFDPDEVTTKGDEYPHHLRSRIAPSKTCKTEKNTGMDTTKVPIITLYITTLLIMTIL